MGYYLIFAVQQKIRITLYNEVISASSVVDVDNGPDTVTEHVVKDMTKNKKKKNLKKDSLKNYPKSTQKEIGGPKGLEPTRYGDWEKKGRCIDF